MDNISTVSKASMVRDALFGTQSPPLGDKPEDHFIQPRDAQGRLVDDAEVENVIVQIFKQAVEGLPPEDKKLLAAFVGAGASDEEAPSLEDVQDIIEDVVEQVVEELLRNGEETPVKFSQDDTLSLQIMSIAQEVLNEIQREISGSKKHISATGNADVDNTSLLQTKDNATLPHKERDMMLADMKAMIQTSRRDSVQSGSVKKEISEVSAAYFKGMQHISTHYGDPVSYRSEAILSAGGIEAVTPQISTILPMASMLGEILHDVTLKGGDLFSREIGLSDKILHKSDMVMDSKMTSSIINKAIEAMDRENKSNQNFDFSLKIHPKSMGEVNVVVHATRDQINIAIQALPEAVDKIKSDMVYFSNQYDNMKWKLNDQELKRDGQGSGSGYQSSQGDEEVDVSMEEVITSSKIINLII